MRMNYLVRPNVDSEPLRVEDAEIGAWGYWVLDDERWERHGNWLRGCGAVAVETGALNEDDDLPWKYRTELEVIGERLAGCALAIDVDETYTKLRNRTLLNLSPQQVAERVWPVYETGIGLGLVMRPLEAYPAVPMREILEYLHHLIALGWNRTRITLDIDFDRLDREAPKRRWYHRRDPAHRYWQLVYDDFRAARTWATDAGVELGAIVGSPMPAKFPRTSEGFVAAVEDMARRVRLTLQPDVWVVQSWERDVPGYEGLTYPEPDAFRRSVEALR